MFDKTIPVILNVARSGDGGGAELKKRGGEGVGVMSLGRNKWDELVNVSR